MPGIDLFWFFFAYLLVLTCCYYVVADTFIGITSVVDPIELRRCQMNIVHRNLKNCYIYCIFREYVGIRVFFALFGQQTMLQALAWMHSAGDLSVAHRCNYYLGKVLLQVTCVKAIWSNIWPNPLLVKQRSVRATVESLPFNKAVLMIIIIKP